MLRFFLFCCCSFLLLYQVVAEEKLPIELIKTETATFGGGCFWCLQPAFDHVDGVISTTVGFMGGEMNSPTYEQVSAGETGHTEVIQIVYNPELISYSALIAIYWQNVEYTTNSGAIDGRNTQYRSVIFTHGAEQATLAHLAKDELSQKNSSLDVITAIEPASEFHQAAEKHQNYYAKKAYSSSRK